MGVQFLVATSQTAAMEMSDPPKDYSVPSTVWLVEYVDPREPEVGSRQVGGFTTEVAAQQLKELLEDEGFLAELRLNMVPIHERIEDWRWDR